ncbi:hypothetical protein EII34_09570 [Arachnia propionica]|uniref:DUF7824 domain-containing protein n=1 Tax=Arachnia propionica TaxID=1750 RepID=A0A3P1T4V1_9ACTN|nr:DUF6493 family protein [Arachnia propionica]RRD04547.1 hypothetical protein EII34_09570 [Arachnia propionica]
MTTTPPGPIDLRDLVLTDRPLTEMLDLAARLELTAKEAMQQLRVIQAEGTGGDLEWLRSRNDDVRFNRELRYQALALVLPLTPLQFTRVSSAVNLGHLIVDPGSRPRFLDLFRARGRDWLEDYLRRITAVALPLVAHRGVHELILHLGLPLPTEPRFWVEWVLGDGFPRPGREWQRFFLAACASPEAFRGPRVTRDEHRRLVRIDELRAVEPIDDDALLHALVTALVRGERPANQRHLMIWLEDLGLLPRLHEKADLLVGAVPLLDSTVVKELLAQTLRDASPEYLGRLAPEVLSRREKTMRRQVLRALERLDQPSPELVDAVTLAASDPDAEIAALAVGLSQRWGAEVASGLGLWQDPSLPQATELAETTATDLPRLLLQEPVEGDLHVPVENFTWLEQVLAALVAHGYEHGRADTVTVVSTTFERGLDLSLPRKILDDWVAAEHEARKLSPVGWRKGLDLWAEARILDALGAVGRVPCLLSTPTHSDGHLAWQVLVERLGRYEAAGVEPVASDLYVALGRVFDDDGSPVPIAEEAVRAWRATPPGEPEPVVAEQSVLMRMLKGQRRGIKVTGDESPLVKVLGLGSPWDRSPWWRPQLADWGWGTRLLPRHPGQAWGYLLKSRRSWSAASWLGTIGGTVPRFGALGSFVALVITVIGHREREEEMATALVEAWDEGRVTADDLMTAWRSPWWQEWWWRGQRDPRPLARVLIMVAESGGLQLAWPLLVTAAEEIAAMDPLPEDAFAVLEAVLRYLPEVPEVPPMPAVAALARRRSSSKAVRAAKQIART